MSKNTAEFLQGTYPNPLPNGFLKGSVNVKTNWQGKRFEAKNDTGINIFLENGKKVEKYKFKTYRDGERLAIDYNLPSNPFYLRLLVDELVQVKKGEYLGRLTVRILPGVRIPLGFFKLRRL